MRHWDVVVLWLWGLLVVFGVATTLSQAGFANDGRNLRLHAVAVSLMGSGRHEKERDYGCGCGRCACALAPR